MTNRTQLAAFSLAALALVIAGILLIMENTVPTELWMIVLGSGGIGAGVEIPKAGQ